MMCAMSPLRRSIRTAWDSSPSLPEPDQELIDTSAWLGSPGIGAMNVAVPYLPSLRCVSHLTELPPLR